MRIRGKIIKINENEKKFRKYLKKYHPDKYNQLIVMETTEKNNMMWSKLVETKKRIINENEKRFRKYLKKYHPDKYDKLIAMEKEKRSPYPFVSILIPTRNNEKDLVDCLGSIKALDYDLGCIEIIIWDNNSSAEGKEKIKSVLSNISGERMLRIEFIENTANYGVYTSRDQLFKRVSPDAEFVLSIDDDVILPSQLFKKLFPLFQQDNSIGIIGPRTVYDDTPSETAHGAGFVTGGWVIIPQKMPGHPLIANMLLVVAC